MVNCTSSALKIAAGIGINLPAGIGPAESDDYLQAWGPEKIPNPYALNNQMVAKYPNYAVVNTSIFPKP
jgi:hypothetical protein